MATKRTGLGLVDATMLIVGSMVGSGIFMVSAAMANELHSAAWVLIAWLFTAVFTVCGALCYGELAAAMPKAGGQYIYLREAFGEMPAFLYGWTFFTVIQTGTIAAVAIAFATFLGLFIPGMEAQTFLGFITLRQLVAVTVIMVLTLFNFRGVGAGALVQNVFTAIKVLALAVLIAAGAYALNTRPNLPPVDWSRAQTPALTALAAALVGSIFSADAWNNVTFMAGETRRPERNLPLSLLLGTGGVCLSYVLLNYLYFNLLGFDGVAHAQQGRVGAAFADVVFNASGAKVVGGIILVSTFGCVNGLVFSGARVLYALARDGYFLPAAAHLNQKQAPASALTMQAVWASALCLTGAYNDLLDYVVVAVLAFYALTVAGQIVLRRKQPHLPRPYKTIAYPILPIVYIGMAVALTALMAFAKPRYSLASLAIVALGGLVYVLVRSVRRGSARQ